MFDDILYRKKSFLDNKNINFKKSNNCIFLKGFVCGFNQNLKIFQLLILGKTGKENVFDDIINTKKAF